MNPSRLLRRRPPITMTPSLTEWDKPLGQLIGSMRSVPTGDVEIPYHGDIVFYTSIGSREEGTFEWFEYKARFTEGRLQWIKRVESEWNVGGTLFQKR